MSKDLEYLCPQCMGACVATGDQMYCKNVTCEPPVRFPRSFWPANLIRAVAPPPWKPTTVEAWIQEGRELMRDPITMVRCREWAAQAWCNEETGDIEMDSRLANAFAGILYGALTRESPK